MARLQNRYINITAKDVVDSATPMGGQRISGSSDYVGEFEKELARYFGVGRAVTVNSGTVSIYCALRALDIGPGDEVLLPATGVVMTGLPVNLLGAKVVFADNTSEPSFGLDAAAVEAAITERTKAVISVPLWGYPVPMKDLAEVCKRKNVHLIEDIAQAHGTSWDGQLLGTFGVMGCASTHERKLITTGEGGFVITNDEAAAEKINTFRRYGYDGTGVGTEMGLNLKLSGLAAAVGKTQVLKLDEKIMARTKVAEQILSQISGVAWLEELTIPSHSRKNYYSMVCRITDPSISRVELDAHLEKHDVVTDTWRYGFKPLYDYPLFVDGKSVCPNAEKLISEVFTLPTLEGMNEQDVQQVANAVASFK